MPYSSDPAESRRIVRQSLISSATRLHQNDPKTPEEIIEIARIWEAYVYEAGPATQYTPNGTETHAPVGVTLCAECSQPLGEVKFKKGSPWTAEHLAQQGLSKYGQALCKTHFFGRAKV